MRKIIAMALKIEHPNKPHLSWRPRHRMVPQVHTARLLGLKTECKNHNVCEGKFIKCHLPAENDTWKKALETARAISTSRKLRNWFEKKIALLPYRKEKCETPKNIQDRQNILEFFENRACAPSVEWPAELSAAPTELSGTLRVAASAIM